MQRGDNLWDLAEHFLGDGMRWREIRDLNVDRPQPGGATLQTSGDIYPGWALLLPSRIHASAQTATIEPPAAPSVTVEKGGTLWDLADEYLGEPFRWPYIYERNRGKPQPDGRKLTDPDHIHPGWLLHLPQVETHPDGTQAPPTAQTENTPAEAEPRPPNPQPLRTPEPLTTSPFSDSAGSTASPHVPRVGTSPPADRATPHDDNQGENALTSAPGDEEADDWLQDMAVLTSAAALAAGLVLTLDRLRRARLRRRQPGQRIPLPDHADATVETHLRTIADPETANFVDLALRHVVAANDDLQRNPLPVVFISHSPDDLAVHLDAPHSDPPARWQSHDDGLTWVLPRPPNVAELNGFRGTPSHFPSLVTAGTAEGGRTVLLNLGHARTLHLSGDPNRVTQLLISWALELATTPRADALQIVTFGLQELPGDLERLEALTNSDEVRASLESPALTAEGSAPTTVVLASDVDEELADRIRTAAGLRPDLVAAIAAQAPSPDAWSLHLHEEIGHLHPEELSVRLLDLSPEELATGARLLDQAKHDPDRPIPLPELDEGEPAATQSAGLPPAVEVRILGPVEITGTGPLETNKTIELVVYLAMHRTGVDTDTLLEALWPNQPPRAARLYTEASRARKALGVAPDGTPYLPEAELGRYRLSERAALDYEQFRARMAEARRNPDHAEPHLRDALTLVRGVPLSATATEYAWAHPHALRIAQEIADAAHQLAQLYLGQQRYEDAVWAAEQGLAADPVAEVLIRDLMEAAAATGNTARIHAVMTRLTTASPSVALGGDELVKPG